MQAGCRSILRRPALYHCIYGRPFSIYGPCSTLRISTRIPHRRFYVMDIKQIECFIAVAEELNFTTAAEKMYLSQPSLSRHIQNLEKELNITLFIRDKRNVILTNAGSQLLTLAKMIVNDADEFIHTAHGLKTGKSGNLIIGYQNTASSVISEYLKSFISSYPHINLTIKEYNSVDLLNKISSREMDAAIVYTNSTRGYDFSSLNRQLFYQDEMALFLGAEKFENYREKYESTGLTLKDFENEFFLTVDQKANPSYHDFLVEIYQHHGLLAPKYPIKQPDLLSVLMVMVRSNMGVALMPKHTTLASYPDCKCIDLLDIHEALPIEILWNKNNTNHSLDFFLNVFNVDSRWRHMNWQMNFPFYQRIDQ